MYIVGIDISKFKHDCFIMTHTGEIIREVFTFANDAAGFTELKSALEGLPVEETRIGFESTGHYGLNLKLFLEKGERHFMELNPLLVKKFSEGQSLRKTKNDRIDARKIAKFMLQVDYEPHPKAFYHNYSLKSLTRLRDDLVNQRSQYLVRLTNVLDHVFPEFKPLFGEFTVTSLYILEHYGSPESIANMNSRSYGILRRVSHGNFTIQKFNELKTAARDTVGEWNDIFGYEMKMLLELYGKFNVEIKACEDKITKLVKEMNPPTLSVRGIGPVSAAAIVAEVGDFTRFSNADKLLSFMGLEPAYYQSGQSEHSGHMVKRGSPHLRKTVLNCCRAIHLHNEVFANYYHKKLGEGKPYTVVLTYLAKKLVRVLYKLETTGSMFNAALLR